MDTLEQEDVQSSELVVVGSSAGAIEALSILVSTLPEDFPAPLVLAQHLDPSRPSSLDVILRKRTTLTVEIVQTDTKLHPGRIYVVPANRHVSIKDHQVHLMEDRMKRPRPSVDTLLTSAAESYGDHLIAIILTGSGDEGNGIAEEDQAHLFEHFYRVHAEANGVDGLGLGLYISSSLVRQHGGRIWVVSKPGQGSTFFFALPLETQVQEQ